SGSPLMEHDDTVNYVSFENDNRRIASAAEDGTARIWDGDSAKALGPPLFHAAPVRYVAFGSNGRVVTAIEDGAKGNGQACVWEAVHLVFHRPTAQKIQGASPTDRTIRRAWFSPNGRYLLALSEGNAGQVWDTTTGKPVLDAIRYKSTISEASFSADGTRLVTATFLHANTVRLWEAGGRQAAELVHLLKPENTATVWQLPEGKRITSVGESGAPTLFRHASLGHDGARLLLIQDGAAQIRDADTGQLIRSVHKPGTAVIG